MHLVENVTIYKINEASTTYYSHLLSLVLDPTKTHSNHGSKIVQVLAARDMHSHLVLLSSAVKSQCRLGLPPAPVGEGAHCADDLLRCQGNLDLGNSLVHIVTRIEKRFRSDFKTIAMRFLTLDHIVKC